MTPKEIQETKRLLNNGYLLFYKGATYGVQVHSQLVSVEKVVFALLNYSPETIKRNLVGVPFKWMGRHPVNVTTAKHVRELDTEIQKMLEAYARQKKQAMILFEKVDVNESTDQ